MGTQSQQQGSRAMVQNYMNDPIAKEKSEYFTLGDLWDCYEEWSSYGVGASIALKNNENVVQYYAPCLSAIQIYTIKSPTILRNLSENHAIDGLDLELESVSEVSGSEKLSRTSSNNSTDSTFEPAEGSRDPLSGSVSSRDVVVNQQNVQRSYASSMNVNENRLGYMYFQHSEIASPCWRIPLVEKIYEFSEKHPGLQTLKSVDLSPASWMAVAWYPIYHVPMKGITKNISTYFLTYHTLSASFQDDFDDDICKDLPIEKKEKGGIPLPPFGLVPYKMQDDIWLNKTQAYEKFNDLYSAADSWLKQLNFNHQDFKFFTSNSYNMDHVFLY
uniref:Uncharacterized protein n=1 Tax=Nicotiana tabacum TaxID=4097 RepID=A0A1S3Y7P0_TOBAC|nr:PREDICTED: uncharacterized protein LOC107773377 [Nicotiana tabacum]